AGRDPAALSRRRTRRAAGGRSARRVLKRRRGLVPESHDVGPDELHRRDHRDRDHGEGDGVLREVLPALVANQPSHVRPQLAAFCSVLAAWFQSVVTRVPTSCTAAITAIVITASAIAYSARSCPRSPRINRVMNVMSAFPGSPVPDRRSDVRPPGPTTRYSKRDAAGGRRSLAALPFSIKGAAFCTAPRSVTILTMPAHEPHTDHGRR